MKEKFFKALKFLKEPPFWFICTVWGITLVAVAAALVAVFTEYTGILAYAAYAVAAVTLGYTVYIIARFAPKIKNRAKAAMKRGNFTKKLTENYHFRTLVFAACSFTVNVGFVLFNTVSSIRTKNAWYASLAGYYFLLSALRGGVFWGNKQARKRAGADEEKYRCLTVKNYGYCGAVLLLLDIAMAVAVTFMVVEQKPVKYSEIMAIVFAAYAFYKIAFAIWNIVKAHRTKELQTQAFRNIGLADAAVSLLSLQTTLISTFSVEGESMMLLNAMTGGFVCLLTVGMGLSMWIWSYRTNKKGREYHE